MCGNNSQSDDNNSTIGSYSSECPYNEEPAPEPEPTVTIRFSLFYDGTLNNRTNVGRRISQDDTREGSYQNDYSNIAKLETIWGHDRTLDHDFSIYIEGIGTDNSQDDSNFPGAALGRGDYGVLPKVRRGVNQAVQRIGRLGITDPIDYVYVDTFGFSRGAAAARNAVHQITTTLLSSLTNLGLSVGEVKIKFVGLFDTVASYGVNHSNDTRELELDAISAADKVVQLAAAEEHRANFRLTNINSSGASGTQYFLPGVHSDVGGGYVDGATETEHLLFTIRRVLIDSVENRYFERERHWFVWRGWYTEDELSEPLTWTQHELRATRRNINNKYARIPMHIMADHARNEGIIFSSRLQSGSLFLIPSELNDVKQQIESDIAEGLANSPNYYFNRSVENWHKDLRHEYLHVSAYYGATMGAHDPEFTEQSIMGQRIRTIQNG